MAVALFSLALVELQLPPRWSLLVELNDPDWALVHDWWAALLALAGLVWALCTPEPLRRRPTPFRTSGA